MFYIRTTYTCDICLNAVLEIWKVVRKSKSDEKYTNRSMMLTMLSLCTVICMSTFNLSYSDYLS